VKIFMSIIEFISILFCMFVSFYLIVYVFILNNAGGVIHFISNRPGGVTIDIVYRLFFEYIIVISVLVIVFSYIKKTMHWLKLSVIGCFIFLIKWYEVQYFIKELDYSELFSIVSLLFGFILISFSAISISLIKNCSKHDKTR
jgi:magnesium-transporting ATPase (P-type)